MAQEDNLGDIEIRKKLLHSIASTGIDIFVLRGDSSDSYVEAFENASNCRWFTSAASLQIALLVRLLSGDHLHFFIAPGPARFSSKPKAIAKSLVNLTNMALARISGGTAHIVGRAYRGTGVTRLIEITSIKLATSATVRDELSSQNVNGKAKALPDLAFFGQPFSGGERRYLAICVREENDIQETAFGELISAGRALNLVPIFVTQVKRDNPWMKRMANQYKTEIVEWTDASHQEQRNRVEAVYRGSRVVVSNRLHGLIMSAMAGAQPLPLVSRGDSKLLPTLNIVFPKTFIITANQLPQLDIHMLSTIISDWKEAEQSARLIAANRLLQKHFERINLRLLSS
jgi:hypothetical protein